MKLVLGVGTVALMACTVGVVAAIAITVVAVMTENSSIAMAAIATIAALSYSTVKRKGPCKNKTKTLITITI